MNGILTRAQLKRPGSILRLAVLLTLLLFMLVILFWEPVTQSRMSAVDQDEVIAAIEERYGLHITMIAVTAGGGVVDFRFQIVDPEKANAYMHGPYGELPVLFVEGNGARIDPRPHTHHVDYEFGRTYYTIYRNPGGVVSRGAKITAVLGDLQLKHIVVK